MIAEATTEMATLATGGILWNKIEQRCFEPKQGEEKTVNLQRCFDILAVCEEHGVDPDPHDVVAFLVDMLREARPGEFDDYERASLYVLRALK